MGESGRTFESDGEVAYLRDTGHDYFLHRLAPVVCSHVEENKRVVHYLK